MAKRKPRPSLGAHPKWGMTELSMLGRYTDAELAQISQRTIAEVIAKRESLENIPIRKRKKKSSRTTRDIQQAALPLSSKGVSKRRQTKRRNVAR